MRSARSSVDDAPFEIAVREQRPRLSDERPGRRRQAVLAAAAVAAALNRAPAKSTTAKRSMRHSPLASSAAAKPVAGVGPVPGSHSASLRRRAPEPVPSVSDVFEP